MEGLTRRDSTFFRVEAPTLAAHGYEQITAVNAADFKDQRKFALYTGKPVRKRSNTNETSDLMQERDNISYEGYSLNWEGYGDDPNGNCLMKWPGPPYAGGRLVLHDTLELFFARI